ncbi:MAG: polyprenol monophosphomannose synthase [Anaerolineae bacterium]|nr:polyprenol monophosphomannose synthase [Anaerolineae bacterium]
MTMVVIPTYNEADNLPALTRELFGLGLPDLQILIVDDASPDGTGELAEGLRAAYPGRFHVIHRPGKLGLGTAYITGFRYALDRGAVAIVQMDADFSHSPTYVPILLSHLDQYDVVVGSRYVPGGRLDERWGWWRYLLSWWANSVYTRLILGIQVRDATAGFKAWRRQALEGIDLNRVRSNGYVFQVEMAYVAEKLGYRVLEVPIYFEDRRIGKSKMSVPIKLEAAWRVWELRRRYRHLSRPSSDEKPQAASERTEMMPVLVGSEDERQRVR